MSWSSWFLPSGKVSFHHAPNSILLPRRREDDEPGYVSLADLCRDATPTKCQLNPLLFNGHLQTAWTVVKNIDVPIYYKRWTFQAHNDNYSGSFDVDFVVDKYETSPVKEQNGVSDAPQELPPRTIFFTKEEFGSLSSNDSKPMLLVFHGLSGGSHEIYLRHVLEPLVQQGWEACVLNFRGCAKSKVTGSVLYNARATWDVRQLVQWVRETFPSRPLFGIGFSLGANILTNVCLL